MVASWMEFFLEMLAKRGEPVNKVVASRWKK